MPQKPEFRATIDSSETTLRRLYLGKKVVGEVQTVADRTSQPDEIDSDLVQAAISRQSDKLDTLRDTRKNTRILLSLMAGAGITLSSFYRDLELVDRVVFVSPAALGAGALAGYFYNRYGSPSLEEIDKQDEIITTLEELQQSVIAPSEHLGQ